MATTDVKNGPERFAKKYLDSYPPEIKYRRPHKELVASSTRPFRTARGRIIEELLSDRTDEIGMPHALLSEFILDLALYPLISPFGYHIDLAAQSIEGGGPKQKGVDLLVVHGRAAIMLGIDVKLGRSKSVFNRNGGGWLDNLMAPCINLTLGNWEVSGIKDKRISNIKEWLKYCVLPNIAQSGKIAGLDSLRLFAVTRIKKSLEYQEERIESNLPVAMNSPLWDRQRKITCKQKLKGLINMFGEIEKNYSKQETCSC